MSPDSVHADREFIFLLVLAIVLFGAAAALLPQYVDWIRRRSKLKRPHRAFLIVFRVWFGALCAGSLVLLLFSRHGLGLGRH